MLDAIATPAWVRMVLPVARPFAAAAIILLAIGLPVLLSADAGAASGVESKATPTTWETTAIAADADVTSSIVSPQTASAAQYADWVVADLSAGKRR